MRSRNDVKILVTGAEGFIGSNLVRRLYEEHEVTALDYVKMPVRNIPDEVAYLNVDLSKRTFCPHPPPDMLLHFATVNQEAVSKFPYLEKVNIKAMLNVLEYCRKYHISLLLASSCSVYGAGVLHKETDPFCPCSLYAVGKVACEEYAKFYHEVYGLDVTILRFSNVYGDTTDITNKHYPEKKDVVRIFMEKALADEPLPIINGAQTRDFTFIDDAVEATIKTIGMTGLNIFNVATGAETSINKLAELVAETLGWTLKTRLVPPRKIDNIPQRSLDITGISNFWKPKWNLREGLKEYASRMYGSRTI